MAAADLNLLVALDALLVEGSVARAARRLRLSPSAMSRALARLREVTGDPLLVRAGRGLVASPRALELRERVGPLLQDAQAVLRPMEKLDLSRLARTFTLRTREGFLENFGAGLIARVSSEAPGVRLNFVHRSDKETAPLREGRVDLDIGVVGAGAGPEVRTRALFRDRFVSVVRRGHPLAKGKITLARYAAAAHVVVSRRGLERGAIEEALDAAGLERRVVAVVDSFSAALAVAAGSELVATVPERHTATLRAGLHAFVPPVALPGITVSLLWHPRMDGDPAHRWLRDCVHAACRNAARKN